MRDLVAQIDQLRDRVIESIEALRSVMEELDEQCPGMFGERVSKLSVSDLLKCSNAIGLFVHKLDSKPVDVSDASPFDSI